MEDDLDDPDVAVEAGYDQGGPSASEEAVLVPAIPGTTFQDLPEAGMEFPTDFDNPLQVVTSMHTFLHASGCIWS